MGWLDKAKGKMGEAKKKLAEQVENFDVGDAISASKAKIADAAQASAEISKRGFVAASNKVVELHGSAAVYLDSVDYEQLKSIDYYQQRFAHYSELGSKKVASAFRSTFEVDTPTSVIVEGIRRGLPVPVQTVDEIFVQVKTEATTRAVSCFFLTDLMTKVDDRSESKYNDLSESYTDYKARLGGDGLTDAAAFKSMKKQYNTAKNEGSNLDNGYHSGSPLLAQGTDIEHVIAKKEIFDDFLVKVGSTDDELVARINDSDNLVFADRSLNRSMKDEDIMRYLQRNGQPDLFDADTVWITIKSKDGELKSVAVNMKDVNESYEIAKANQVKGRRSAVMEIGVTAVKTGSYMAAQQVVGIIVVETVDIFVDELQLISKEGEIFNENGLINNVKEITERIRMKLSERFEQRKLWEKARKNGLEAGVAGALSAIPQIIISMLVKLPSFILALIREATLSVVRCVRVLMSKEDEEKLRNIQFIIAGTASAVVGVYVARAIGGAVSGVPMLNSFGGQISDVLTGVMVTAVPLTAIYMFEKNKNKLSFTKKDEVPV